MQIINVKLQIIKCPLKFHDGYKLQWLQITITEAEFVNYSTEVNVDSGYCLKFTRDIVQEHYFTAVLNIGIALECV